ncbi:putative 5-methylcytosine restriction system, catalytic subunit [Thermococcus camini]|uniref:Putative 5-methylcytosine restriction system, catalytic subunit n=2 Tax=Thermococcus camini TaxID=2016373 RepID=A0A7G2DC37_9EURY|nr:putative 5-methylcytosine restriction system, catalytic subunit [Thermococcus camini]
MKIIRVPEHSIDYFPNSPLWRAVPKLPIELVKNQDFREFISQINNGHNPPILIKKYNRLVAGPYIGFAIYEDRISRRRYQIEIYPKVFRRGAPSKDGWKLVLKLADLYYNIGLREYNIKTSLAVEGKSPFLDIILNIFANSLLNELRFGVYGEFITYEERSSSLRGQLLVEREVLKLPTQKHKFDTRYKKFTADNPLNQILKYALYLGLQYAYRKETKKILSEAWDILNDISLVPITSDSIERVTLNSLNLRFKLPLELAKMIITGLEYHSHIQSPGFFINMPDVFEFLVYKLFDTVLMQNYMVRYHPQDKEFVIEQPRKFINEPPQPDIIIESKSGKPLLIVDAKYKPLYCRDCMEKKRYVKNSSDLYQLYSYVKLYGVRGGLLVYPMLKNPYTEYNQWLCDVSSTSKCGNSIFHFFDGTKLGILGIDLGHVIRDSIKVFSGKIVKVSPEIQEQLIMYINSLSKGTK